MGLETVREDARGDTLGNQRCQESASKAGDDMGRLTGWFQRPFAASGFRQDGMGVPDNAPMTFWAVSIPIFFTVDELALDI